MTRRDDATIDVGAFGKGEALDRVEAALGAGAWLVDLGGQVTVGGPQPDDTAWIVDVAHPTARNTAQLQVSMREGSLSTSGGSERDLLVDGTRIAHHLDPRTGQPATYTGSVTVWHRSGLAADVLTTALYVQPPRGTSPNSPAPIAPAPTTIAAAPTRSLRWIDASGSAMSSRSACTGAMRVVRRAGSQAAAMVTTTPLVTTPDHDRITLETDP